MSELVNLTWVAYYLLLHLFFFFKIQWSKKCCALLRIPKWENEKPLSSFWRHFRTFVYSGGTLFRWYCLILPLRILLRGHGWKARKIRWVRRGLEEVESDLSRKADWRGRERIGAFCPLPQLSSLRPTGWDCQLMARSPLQKGWSKLKNKLKEWLRIFFSSSLFWVTFIYIWLCLQEVVWIPSLEAFFTKKIPEIPKTLSPSTVAFM